MFFPGETLLGLLGGDFVLAFFFFFSVFFGVFFFLVFSVFFLECLVVIYQRFVWF